MKIPNMISLEIENKIYEFWTSITVSTSLDRIARTAEIHLTDMRTIFSVGLPVKIFVDENLILTGYIYESSTNFHNNRYNQTITIVSKTQDLVDCSPPHIQFKKTTPQKIIQTLTEPYNIRVKSGVSLPSIDFQTDFQDNIVSNIMKIAEESKFWIYDDEFGDLVLSTSFLSPPLGVLYLNKNSNIINANITKTSNNLYSHIEAVGQRLGDENDYGEKTTTQKITVNKNNIRYRRRILFPHGQHDMRSLKQYVDWWVNFQEAESLKITCEYPSWYLNENILKTGQMVNFVSEYVSGDFVIHSVQYNIDPNRGIGTELELRSPKLYEFQPSHPTFVVKTKQKETQKKNKTYDEGDFEYIRKIAREIRE